MEKRVDSELLKLGKFETIVVLLIANAFKSLNYNHNFSL